MTWRPTATRAALERRAQLLTRTRRFFAERGVLEVETPILSAAAATDPALESLVTRIVGTPGPFFAQTSPEYAMKRLLAADSGDIYQICKVFRDAETGRWHNPEFTMLEWYRVGFDDSALMDEVEALLRLLLAPGRMLMPAERLTYSAALLRHAGVDPHAASDADLTAAAVRHGIRCNENLDRDVTLDLLMGFVVGPKLGAERPCFICDYPASQAALARLKPGTPAVAARFELYLDGIELANGFHELAEGSEQRSRFERDLATRTVRGQVRPPIDERFLAALAAGLPDCAGVAVGFDRVLALALNANCLAATLTFDVFNA